MAERPRAEGVALVTGATGFVGSHLVESLVQEGWRVRCLARPTSSLRWVPADTVEVVRGSVEDPTSLRTALDRVRVVFHLAGVTSAASPAAYARVNVGGTRTVLETMAERAPEALLVFCSSLAAAGPSPDGKPLTEDDPPHPIGPYGDSKLAAERLVASSGLDHVIVRPPAVYGPRDRDILAAFRLAAKGIAVRIGSGGQRLSLVHVRDLAHALIDAAELGAGRGVFYVSDGAIHSWSEIAGAIASAVGRRVRTIRVPAVAAAGAGRASRLVARLARARPLLTPERARDLAQPSWVCDDSRARAELGYRSVFDLSSGMLDTAAWYRANGWLPA